MEQRHQQIGGGEESDDAEIPLEQQHQAPQQPSRPSGATIGAGARIGGASVGVTGSIGGGVGGALRPGGARISASGGQQQQQKPQPPAQPQKPAAAEPDEDIQLEQQHQQPTRPGAAASTGGRVGGSVGLGGRADVGIGIGASGIQKPIQPQKPRKEEDVPMEQQHQEPSRPGGATLSAGGRVGVGIGVIGKAGSGSQAPKPQPQSPQQQQKKDTLDANIPIEQQHQPPQRPSGVTISGGGSVDSRKTGSSKSSGDGGLSYKSLKKEEQEPEKPQPPQKPLQHTPSKPHRDDSEDTEMIQQRPQYGTFDPGMDIPMEQMHQQPQRPGSVTISVGGSGDGRKPGGSRTSGDGGPPYRALEEEPSQEHKTLSDEENYRIWLTITFKLKFEPFEPAGGMPLEEFQLLISQHDIGRKHKLKTLFKQLDKDGNRRVSWTEFYEGMTYKKKSEVSRTDRIFNRIIKKLTPAAKRMVREAKKEAENEGDPIPEESYLEAYNCRPPPIFFPLTFLAIWIFFAVYAVELNRGPDWNHVGWETGLPYYSPLVFCPSVRQQAWRFISYMFLHDGFHHIIFNTLVGLILGVPLETVHKVWRVGPVFLIGVFAGALASSIIDPKSALVGASGGVYSLIGAHYATVLMNWEELQSDWLKCRGNPLKFLLSGVMTLVYLTLFVGIDFGVSAYRRYAMSYKVPMSVSAHVGGMLAGLLVGTPVLRNIDKKPWEGVVAIVAIVAACIVLAFGVLWNIFYKGYPKWDEAACSNPSLVD